MPNNLVFDTEFEFFVRSSLRPFNLKNLASVNPVVRSVYLTANRFIITSAMQVTGQQHCHGILRCLRIFNQRDLQSLPSIIPHLTPFACALTPEQQPRFSRGAARSTGGVYLGSMTPEERTVPRELLGEI